MQKWNWNSSINTLNLSELSDVGYYPFGMVIKERSYSGVAYRFGFSGMEQDNEVKGSGNSIDFGARIYDSRLGKWSSVDPLQARYAPLSPYNYCGNNPILLVDVDGRWFVKFDDAENPLKLVFVAEEGDNLSTLEIQMGMEPGSLSKNENLSTIAIENGTELSCELEVIETVQNINNYLNENVAKSPQSNNCAMAAQCAKGSNLSDVITQGFNGSVELLSDDIANNSTPVQESSAKVGDIVTYKSSWESIYWAGSSDSKNKSSLTSEETKAIINEYGGIHLVPAEVWKSAESMKTPEEMVAEVDKVYGQKQSTNKFDHFAVVLLKTKDGGSVKTVFEKPGSTPVKLSEYNGTPDTPDKAHPKVQDSPNFRTFVPSGGTTGSPIHTDKK
jgi:RHS repeat-associated protein